MIAVTTVSTLTCPHCGGQVTEAMPLDLCVVRWRCPACGAEVRPAPGDCCVYCTYGSVPCPPIQRAGERPGCGSNGG
jgi:hypothetical protein